MSTRDGETTKNYLLFEINSADRTVGENSGTANNFTVALPGKYSLSKYRIVNAQIKHTWYNINSSNNKIDFTEDGGAEINITIPPGNYSTTSLATAIRTAMDAAGAKTYTVSLSSTNYKTTIAIDTGGGTFDLLWNTGANTAETIGSILGFIVTADSTASASYTSPNVFNLTGADKIYIKTNTFTTKYNGVSHTNDPTDNALGTLAAIPIVTNPGCTLFFEDWEGTVAKFVRVKPKTTTINVQLKFYNNVDIDLNGSEWSLTIAGFK